MNGVSSFSHFQSNGSSLEATFVFDTFISAFGFMTQIAIWAEKLDHHPTFINTYNKVEIKLTTHDAGNSITEKDTDLAEKIEMIYKKM